MKVSFAQPGLPTTGTAVVSVTSGGKLLASAEKLDKKTGGALKRAIRSSQFTGDKGQSLNIMAPSGVRLDRIILVGFGKVADISELEIQKIGGKIYAETCRGIKGVVTVAVDPISGAQMSAADMAAHLGYGSRLRSYRFDKYKTKLKQTDKPSIKTITFQCTGFANARKAFRALEKIAAGVFFTRDLVSEPANILYPDSFAKQTKSLEKLGVKVEELGEAQMRRLGMGALLGVGQGSIRESRMVVMQWNGGGSRARGKKAEAPVAFVGKGVTFDTGDFNYA